MTAQSTRAKRWARSMGHFLTATRGGLRRRASFLFGLVSTQWAESVPEAVPAEPAAQRGWPASGTIFDQARKEPRRAHPRASPAHSSARNVITAEPPNLPYGRNAPACAPGQWVHSGDMTRGLGETSSAGT